MKWIGVSAVEEEVKLVRRGSGESWLTFTYNTIITKIKTENLVFLGKGERDAKRDGFKCFCDLREYRVSE